jgi:hypothetical protein
MPTTPSGLHVVTASPTMWVKKHYAREKIITLTEGPFAGRRARVHLDDSHTVQHTESDEHMDALVTPRVGTIRVKIDPDRAKASPLLQRLQKEGYR